MKEIAALQASFALLIASLNASSFNRGLYAIVCRTRFIADEYARNLGEVAFYIRDHHMFDLELSHGMSRVDVPCGSCGRYRNCSRRGAHKASSFLALISFISMSIYLISSILPRIHIF